MILSKRSEVAYERTVQWTKLHAWFWVAAVGVLLVGMAATSILSFNDLTVEAKGPVLAIQNAGHSSISILEIVIDDRPDCAPWISTSTGNKFEPIDLKVGDATMWLSTCPIVRARTVDQSRHLHLHSSYLSWHYRFAHREIGTTPISYGVRKTAKPRLLLARLSFRSS